MIAGGIEAALGHDDQFACERRALRRRGDALEALVEFECLEVGGNLDRLTARGKTVLAEVEAHDLLDALDADVESAVSLGERFRVEPALRSKRLAVGPQYGRHFGIGEGRRMPVLVHNAGGEP